METANRKKPTVDKFVNYSGQNWQIIDRFLADEFAKNTMQNSKDLQRQGNYLFRQ